MARLAPYSGPAFPDRKSVSGEEYLRQKKETLAALERASDSLPPGEVVGGLLRWQVGDDYAIYRVVQEKPLTVEHIPTSYMVDPALIRGLRLSDVRRMLEQHRELKRIFGGRVI